jgi:L-lactate dehydrogenase complex protein LldG
MNMNRSTDARETMLRRIRAALQDVPASEPTTSTALPRTYLRSGTAELAELSERFVERATDYKVTVWRVEAEELPQSIARLCAERGIRRLVVPADLPSAWLPAQVELLRDETTAPLSNEQLDGSDGVLTGCALAIAQTGSIVLDSGTAQGRRALTLIPDYHLCVIDERQIVDLVPEAITQLSTAVKQHGRPLTFISGPSATSDIELNRVEGVHGPRTLEVLLVKHPL